MRLVNCLRLLVVSGSALFLAACPAKNLVPARPSAAGAKTVKVPKTVALPEIYFHKLGDSALVSAPIRTIEPAGVSLAPTAPATAEGSGYVCPFANQQRNSRAPYALQRGKWRVQWRVELEPQVRPAFVLQQGAHIYVHGREWRIFDPAGKKLFLGITGGPPAVLDSAKGLVYRIGGGGDFLPTSLEDGKRIFDYLPSRGGIFSRTMIVRRGDRFIIGGNERQLDPTGRHRASDSELEILDAPEPHQTTELGTLTSGMVNGVLQFRSSRVRFATVGDTIVAAAPGFVYLIDWDLKIRIAIATDLDAELMSLDEAGRIYLMTKADKGTSLHLLTPKGERIFSRDLSLRISEVRSPPIVAYDHTVFVLAESKIVALGASVEINWTRNTRGPCTGAIVTPEGHLIVAEDDSIVSWDAEGNRELLFSTGGDRLVAPPVLTAEGKLLAISNAHLYCLLVTSEVDSTED